MVCHKPGNLIKIVFIFCVYYVIQLIFFQMFVLEHYSCHETRDFIFLEVSMRNITLYLLYGLLVYGIEVKVL